MKKIEKKIVVEHLETRCDRKLILSILNHGGKKNLSDSEREHLKVPDPFKLRSRGLGISKDQGIKLEKTYYSIIEREFEGNSLNLHSIHASNQMQSEKDFLSRCRNGIADSTIFLEASFNTEHFMEGFYKSISTNHTSLLHLGFMRPDIILATTIHFFNSTGESIFEVLPDGDLKPVSSSESRICFFISDVKLAEEPNISQFGETALYAWMLSNWIKQHNLHDRYLVVDCIGIWTKKTYVNDSSIGEYRFAGSTVLDKLKSWKNELCLRTFDQYMLSIKQILTEDIPRVISKKEAWKDLEFHLTPSCDTCDYLGMMNQSTEPYFDPKTKNQKFRNYENLCAHCAYRDKHLSIVPGVTKGARRALNLGGINSALDIKTCEKDLLRTHSELKKQQHRIVEKTDSLLRRDEPTFFPSKNITLARLPNLGIMFHINYDMSNGLAASFSTQGAYFAMSDRRTSKEDRPEIKFFEKKIFIVEKMDTESELLQLKSFLHTIENMFDWASDPNNNPDPSFNMNTISTRPTVQFYCWDRYQLDFMKKVLSRHLDVLVSEKYSRSLLWLFSPDELIRDPAFFRSSGKQGNVIAPYICVLKDIIQEDGKWPIEAAYPLLVVASCSDETFKDSYKKTGWLYKSQLGDYIPRERILEIWLRQFAKYDKDAKIERRKKEGLPQLSDKQLEDEMFEDYLNKYKKSASKQIWAISLLRKIIAQSTDIQKLAYAPPILNETILDRPQVFSDTSIKSLPADSQLWSIFTILDDQLELLEYNQEMTSTVQALESRYACIVATSRMNDEDLRKLNIQKKSGCEYYRVSEDSRNCKIRDGDNYLTLLLKNDPGFPFRRPADVLRETQNPSILQQYETKLGKNRFSIYRRFSELISVKLSEFDRINGWIEIQINKSSPVPDLIHDQLLDLENFAVSRSAPLSRNHVVTKCIKEIKHPDIAYPDEVSRRVLLKQKPEKPIKKHEITRAAEVLWSGSKLNQREKAIDEARISNAINRIKDQSKKSPPNQWQDKAIRASLVKSLNVIWGPPGTGKTDTSVYILGSELNISLNNGSGTRILVTGPTKRAVTEILTRLKPILSSLPQEKLKLIALTGTGGSDYDYILGDDWSGLEHKAICYGVHDCRGEGNLREEYKNISDIRRLLESEKSSDSLIVVATHQHSIYPLLSGISIKAKPSTAKFPCKGELFDYVLVDESSQIDVPDSLPILNALDSQGRITFVGDHLQMPPIQQAEVPEDAQHLVGSIQNYLITRHKIEPEKLLTNYRSNGVIVDFGKRLGYPEKLTAANPAQLLNVTEYISRIQPNTYSNQLPDPIIDSIFNPANPVVSIRYRDGMSGQANPFEAMLTINIILRYYQTAKDTPNFDIRFWTEMVGVVTPHKAQRALVIQELCRLFPSKVHSYIDMAVDTVERFQGGERNLILISYGVGDEDIIRQEEEFLLNLNRTNVSISRAKQKVILILSEELLQHISANEQIANHAKALKRFDHYCHNEKRVELNYVGGKKTIKYRWRSGSC